MTSFPSRTFIPLSFLGKSGECVWKERGEGEGGERRLVKTQRGGRGKEESQPKKAFLGYEVKNIPKLFASVVRQFGISFS